MEMSRSFSPRMVMDLRQGETDRSGKMGSATSLLTLGVMGDDTHMD